LLNSWRRGVSWSADVEIARRFIHRDLLTIPQGIIKVRALPEAIICKIEYPLPFTEEEKAEMLKDTPGCHFLEYRDEQEYIVDSTLLTGFEIVERC
jgi:hypothetical protein